MRAATGVVDLPDDVGASSEARNARPPWQSGVPACGEGIATASPSAVALAPARWSPSRSESARGDRVAERSAFAVLHRDAGRQRLDTALGCRAGRGGMRVALTCVLLRGVDDRVCAASRMIGIAGAEDVGRGLGRVCHGARKTKERRGNFTGRAAMIQAVGGPSRVRCLRALPATICWPTGRRVPCIGSLVWR